MFSSTTMKLKDKETLFELIRSGRTDIATLLSKRIDINNVELDGMYVLGYAAGYGNLKVVKYLIERKAKANVINSNGTTPLHLAAKYGHKDVVQFLLGLGVNIDSYDDNRCRPLHYAAAKGQREMVQVLIDNGSDLDASDLEGFTPLTLAVRFSESEIAMLLIRSGANVKCSTARNWTALHYVCSNSGREDVSLAQSLVENGADLNAKLPCGESPLVLATMAGKHRIVEMLLAHGAKVNGDALSVLHTATKFGRPGIIKILLHNGADLEAVAPDEKRTPLHFACWSGRTEVIEILLQAGANCNRGDEKGISPFHLLLGHHPTVEKVKLCIEHGAFIKWDDYSMMLQHPRLKEGVLRDSNICAKAIINLFNNFDLPMLYKVPFCSSNLPPIEKMRILYRGNSAQEIEQSVKHVIDRKGHYNFSDEYPTNLSLLSVRSLGKYIDKRGQIYGHRDSSYSAFRVYSQATGDGWLQRLGAFALSFNNLMQLW